MGVYQLLRFARDVMADLKKLTAYQRLILDAMEEQLSTEPTRATRNRKVLVNLVPPWTV